ncbi:sensor histidine kinase [Tsukamurella strandjordii]|uniref:sensor histidine kinase n=2 Tax=Tsukamurella TaxID=2060 RepID=UPI0039F05927
MARELHDVIAHEVTGIVVLAQAGIAAGADADGTLARIERSGSRALADIRAMVGTLREPGEAPPPLAPSASGSELSASLGDLAQTGVDVTVDPAVDTDDVPDLLRLVAHRVVAEGLTNARRHAPGSTVRVTVGRVDGDLRVDVVDDGASADAPPGPGPGGGTGLIGLAERAATVGGTVTSGPDGPEGAGWRLTAHLPIDGGS